MAVIVGLYSMLTCCFVYYTLYVYALLDAMDGSLLAATGLVSKQKKLFLRKGKLGFVHCVALHGLREMSIKLTRHRR